MSDNAIPRFVLNYHNFDIDDEGKFTLHELRYSYERPELVYLSGHGIPGLSGHTYSLARRVDYERCVYELLNEGLVRERELRTISIQVKADILKIVKKEDYETEIFVIDLSPGANYFRFDLHFYESIGGLFSQYLPRESIVAMRPFVAGHGLRKFRVGDVIIQNRGKNIQILFVSLYDPPIENT